MAERGASTRRLPSSGFRAPQDHCRRGGTTTRQIAGDLGVSEAVLYDHFSSKEEKYSEALLRVSEHMEQHLRTAAGGEAAPDRRGRLLRIARSVSQWSDAEPELVRLLFVSAFHGRDRGGRELLPALHDRLVEITVRSNKHWSPPPKSRLTVENACCMKGHAENNELQQQRQADRRPEPCIVNSPENALRSSDRALLKTLNSCASISVANRMVWACRHYPGCDRTLMLFLYNTGSRVQEAAGLRSESACAPSFGLFATQA